MEGPKRLQLTTMAPVAQPEKKTLTPKTLRFELDITEPSDGTCPEFFFTELQKSTSKADDKSKSDDLFGDDDDADKMAAIAKAFEAKYNKPSDGKKKQKWRDNYYLEQLADGYDESDTFIDNSEAYDEVLPETHTTKHGGFYINSGNMEIKELSDASEDEFRSPMPMQKNKKKRRISSGDESDQELKVVKKKKIKDTLSVDGEVKKKKKKKLIVAPGEKGFKKPKPQEKTKDGKSSGVSGMANSTPPSVNGESHENGIISSDGEDSKESQSNISMVIDSVIAMATNDTESHSELEEPKKEIDPESVPKLPTNMPVGTEEKVERLKAHAKESSDGKCKFFTTNVNKLLLEVELASKQMTVSNRSAVFGHLAAFLPCSKDTLMKRAKNLRVKELEDKIKEPLDKLKQALNAMMPALIEKYDEDCKKAAQEKLEDGSKGTPKVEKDGVKEDAATESDEDEKTNQSDSVKKRPAGPRKKFVWNNELRGFLCDVVRVKMHTLSMLKGKTQSAEEFCKSFLEAEVRPLWPKGWMQTRALFKESKLAHSTWTNPQKPRKIFTVTKNVMPVTSTISKPPSSTVSPASTSASKMPYISVAKVSSGSTVVKTVNMNSNKGNMNTPNTLSTAVKMDKIDYANTPTVSSSVSNNSASVTKTTQQAGNLPSPSVIRMSDLKAEGMSPKQTVSSWNHMVSDILRSSMTDQTSGKSPPQPMLHRQNSNPLQVSQSNASGFMAQFMKHIATGDSVSPKQVSPPQKMPDNIISQHNKYLQQLEVEKHQMKLFKETQEKLKEQKALDSQSVAKQLVSSIQGVSGGQKQTANISGQSRINPSPLNLVMSRNIPVGQSSTKMAAKQSSGQFHQDLSHKKNLTDTLIRQHLNDSSQGSPVLPPAKPVNKSLPSPSNTHFVHVSSTYDALRKTSPQTKTVKITHATQGKTTSPHVVTLNSSQNPVLFKPAAVPTTAPIRPASSLLKSLFSQAQESGQTFPGLVTLDTGRSSQHAGPSPQRSPNQGGSNSKGQGQVKHQWSPNSSSITVQELQARLQSAAGMNPKPYTMAVANTQQIPGFQSVKVSSLTHEQLASYQAQQLKNSSSGSMLAKQMTTPGSKTSNSLNPDLQRYNTALQHYHHYGYPDSTK